MYVCVRISIKINKYKYECIFSVFWSIISFKDVQSMLDSEYPKDILQKSLMG